MRALYPLLPFAVGLAVVGNPSVADVTVVDSHTLYVVGKSYGSTALNVTDAMGRAIYAGDVTVVRPLSSVAVYHGLTRAEFACAPSCAESRSEGAGAAK